MGAKQWTREEELILIGMLERGVSRQKIADTMNRSIMGVHNRTLVLRKRGQRVDPIHERDKTGIRTYLSLRDLSLLKAKARRSGVKITEALREAVSLYLGKTQLSMVEVVKQNHELKDRVRVLEIKLDKVKRAWMD